MPLCSYKNLSEGQRKALEKRQSRAEWEGPGIENSDSPLVATFRVQQGESLSRHSTHPRERMESLVLFV